MYNENGDMVTEAGQVFRQIGWQINGGKLDGHVVIKVPGDQSDGTDILPDVPHGGISPVYVEVGTD